MFGGHDTSATGNDIDVYSCFTESDPDILLPRSDLVNLYKM